MVGGLPAGNSRFKNERKLAAHGFLTHEFAQLTGTQCRFGGPFRLGGSGRDDVFRI